MDLVNLKIDGKNVTVSKGTTIYKAAKSIGIDIPVLCYMDLKDLHIENKPGGCRICSVEVEGRKNLAPSCSTNVTEGMVIRTSSVRVLNSVGADPVGSSEGLPHMREVGQM
jgi:NADP-reducing hydrogenase subunit HndD